MPELSLSAYRDNISRNYLIYHREKTKIQKDKNTKRQIYKNIKRQKDTKTAKKIQVLKIQMYRKLQRVKYQIGDKLTHHPCQDKESALKIKLGKLIRSERLFSTREGQHTQIPHQKN